MNAIHPIFAAALAPITPPSDFDVTIQFTDGEYRNRVLAATEERATQLALTDARIASPYGTFYGKVISSSAVAA